jgi:hypothetical protein
MVAVIISYAGFGHLVVSSVVLLTNPRTSIIINRKKLPNIAPIKAQSGMIRISRDIAIPFCITERGVVEKNGPSSAHWAPIAITLIYYEQEK